MINKIKSFFKKDHDIRNVYHPDVKGNVEHAFNLNGVAYYRFKEDHLMYEMRRFQKIVFFTELENGISHDDLISYIKEIEGHVNKGQLGDTALKLRLLKQRVELHKDPDTFYKIASVEYFDENEELTHYSRDYNKTKIETFKNSPELSFFLTKPMVDIFPQLASLALNSQDFSHEMGVMKELKEQIDALIYSQSFKDSSTISTEN